jgi:hypothetical protein
MRNAGLSEARCQNELSESKAPIAGSITSKARRSTKLTEFSKQTVCPQGSAIAGAYRGQMDNVFKRGCRVPSYFLECGGKRSATPLFFCEKG